MIPNLKSLRMHGFHLLVFVLTSISTMAQDKPASENKWHFLVEPYLMFPNLKGSVGVADLPDASVDESPSDIFSHLQMGAMLYLEAHNDKWAISSDLLYMNLKQDITSDKVINSGKVTFKQLAWELADLYTINSWLELGAGARLNSINSEVNVNINTLPQGTTEDKSKSLTETWIDPIIISRIKFPMKGKWLMQLRTDVGGFGVGSKVAFQAQLDAGYKFSKVFQTTIGYRYIYVNYDKGEGSSHFLYDMTTFGPVVRFGFNF